MNNSIYHKPVMLAECLEWLSINPEGIYVDLTFGGGGHSKAILDQLTSGKLIAFDQDEDAKKNAEELACEKLIFIPANFVHLKKYLRLLSIEKVDGILGDLGVSSHQFDTAERGFSTRFDADLDMRMDQTGSLTAKKIIGSYPEKELQRVFGEYGEVHNAKTLAALIVRSRINNKIETVAQLKLAMSSAMPKGYENKYLAQVFQALRIEVNAELTVLQETLEQSSEVLKKGGRMVIMSYHSLEDRLVKNFFAKGKFDGEVEKDIFGNERKPLKALVKKAITASEQELAINNRGRSAKLRVAEKL